jgi:hypothetical protein
LDEKVYLKKKKILYVFNASWFFLSHRTAVAQMALDKGYEVHVAAAPCSNDKEKIESKGFIFHPIPFKRKGYNIFSEIKTLIKLAFLYKKITPDIVEQATIKPIIYGCFISFFFPKTPIINWMTGLGYVFINNTIKGMVVRKLVSLMYKVLFRRNFLKVIFENPDDRNYFVENGLIGYLKTELIRGAGVDASLFTLKAEPKRIFTVILPARMLWDKGVGDFFKIAKLFKASFNSHVRFVLVGDMGGVSG